MKRVCAAILVFGFFCQLTVARTISESEDLETRELLEELRDAIRMRERELEEQVEEEIKEVEEKKEEEEHLLAVRGAWDDFKASVKKAGKKIKNAFGRRDEEEEIEEVEKEEEEEVEEVEKEEEEEERQTMPSPAEMKEARKHMEAYIAANKGSTDPATKAQVAEMEASLQILAAMGIHKKREEEKRQQPTREQLKEARKQMEAFIAMNKGSTDAKTQADVAEMEQALAMLDLLGIH